jgi:dipeptidyl aminopeptidase/acylaminoacyl peptidase
MKTGLLFFCLIPAILAVGQDSTCEKYIQNLKQLTFGGDNAEAYFSFDDEFLTLQISDKSRGIMCDQIYMVKPNENELAFKQISTGKGRTTCSFFMPGNKSILYASTHASSDSCPPPPAPRKDGKYLWQVNSTYDIYVADLNGNIIKKLTDIEGYDAEATVSPKGDKIVFTSTRNGDLDLYTMNIDGSDVKQITFGLGYDGGAFFSPDGKRLVFRSSRPKTELEVNEYKELLSQGLVAPTEMEIYTCNVDGSDLKQITQLGKANWAPYYHPSGKKILFSSNHHSERGYDFQIYMIDAEGGVPEKITCESNFNAFPMFSYDGKRIVFSSNRNNNGTRDTNVFIADWIE